MMPQKIANANQECVKSTVWCIYDIFPPYINSHVVTLGQTKCPFRMSESTSCRLGPLLTNPWPEGEENEFFECLSEHFEGDVRRVLSIIFIQKWLPHLQGFFLFSLIRLPVLKDPWKCTPHISKKSVKISAYNLIIFVKCDFKSLF